MLSHKKKPFERQRLYEDVTTELGLRIVGGFYLHGAILPSEEELVEEFGVSRTVIREAVKVLTDKGLVQPRQRIGTLIHPRSHWRLLDADVLQWELQVGQQEALLHKVTEARRVIEPEAAALAALRASDEQLQQIEAAFNAMVEAVKDFAAHAEEYIEQDMVFHAIILAGCGNELLAQTADMMRRALVASREITTRIPGNAEKAIPAHRAVLETILRRDSDGARKAMQKLIDQARTDIESAFRQLKDMDD